MNRDRSTQAFEEAKTYFPGGVNSPVRAFGSVDSKPPFIEKAKDQHLYDLDGNKYLDYVLSWGPLILGHADDRVVEVINDQAQKGTSYGATSAIETKLAKIIQDIYPVIESMRFVNSGTEATMTAIRLARGVTKRNLVVKFDGCYHGHSDSFLIEAGSGVATLGIADSPGVPDEVAKLTLSIPFNDTQAVTETFEKHGKDIAAVIIEPIAGNMGLIKSDPEFLSYLRKVTKEHGSLLIFDEVLTGSRASFQGAQGLYPEIKPDLVTLGKVIGGGLPVALFGGRQDLMNYIAPSGPVYQAGTLSGNPLAMAGGIATLGNYSKEDFENIASFVEDLVGGIVKTAEKHGLLIQVPYAGSLFTIFFTDKPVKNYEDSKATNQAMFKAFCRKMLDRGIYFPPSAFEVCFVSTKHTQEDLNFTLKAIDEVFGELVEEKL